ncbi:MAG: ABC transporter ATP-binding protein [Deltaproteobacteria bacterium]|nr:ABC transporter ATP-binding protein [Deltaproteobacteria bacterium]
MEGRFGLDLDAPGVLVLFGPSGCGKTTVLRALAGLDRIDEGTLRAGTDTWAAPGRHVPPRQRRVGMVFQEPALFPHLTVEQNVRFGLYQLTDAEAHARAVDALARTGIAELVDRRPHEISAGQRQRAALARAIAPRPRLLLLDEPLSALDTPSRESLRRALRAVLVTLGIPSILVTHDRTEALGLGDRVVVMSGGRVLQDGPIQDVFSRPCSEEAARVLGVETVVEGRVEHCAEGLCTVAVGAARLVGLAPDDVSGTVMVCIRSEDVVLMAADVTPTSARNHLAARVTLLEPDGALCRVTLDCGFPLVAQVTRGAVAELRLAPGSAVTVLLKAGAVQVVARAA